MLHPVTGDRNQVVTAIRNATAAFTQNNRVVQEKLAVAFPGAEEQARQRIIENLNAALTSALTEETDPKWFTPRGQMAGIVQSAMNEAASAPAPTEAPGLGLAAAPFEQFGPLDPGWIETIIDGFKTLFEGKAPFVRHRNLTDFLHAIPNQCTIALVSDWGGNNDAAHKVSAQIKAQHPDIVIHLGDIYYAGQDDEAKEALGIWPLANPGGDIPPRTSFALNGNHEMFSGGRAYFGAVFQAFGQEASYFGLRNASWQILAFDSAYVEHRLLPPDDPDATDDLRSQWNWLVDKMRNSKLPTIFLSHHQPVSAFAQEHSDAENLRADYKKFETAAGRPVFGWFFGHEHRCTIYDDEDVPYFPRLIGHGCIPHTPPPADQTPDPGCAGFSDMNHAANQNGDAVSGFALLKFDGGSIDIRYINEDGTQFKQEFLQAPLP
jgi:3',5'-cyclic AMP phosphodiesterase CpdA